MEQQKKYPHFLLVFILFTLTFQSAHAFEKWWQCASRQSGDWTFGRAPSICLVDHMQTQAFVNSQYNMILFNDARSRTAERDRYMTELNAVAKETANYYLKKRKPSVSNEELRAFTKGLLTLMHQETVWSHYRRSSDNRIRYMRGDNGHGHGLMQVDDRSHQSHLLQGKGADLIKNMVYGLDVFYSAWQKAPSKSCVNGPKDYTARIRSAWAAYNGGPSRLCRWTSSTGTFAHHDKQFYKKLKDQTFKKYVKNESKKTALNIRCLAEGTRPCANSGTPSATKPTVGEFYQVGSGLYCINAQDSLHCVDRLQDKTCLEVRDNRSYSVLGTLDPKKEGKPIKRLDRNFICLQNIKDLYELTQVIENKKRINIRKTPGGERLGTLPLDTHSTLLDFEVRDRQSQKRYYKIRHKGVEGYIYAGDKSSSQSWVIAAEDNRNDNPIIASIDEQIKIVAPSGINQREKPAGTFIQRIPRGAQLTVVDRVVRGSQNYLYYGINYKGRVGYIYSGYLKSENSVSQWTEVLRTSIETLSLKANLNYRFLRECPKASCQNSSHFLRPQSPIDQVVITSRQGEWVEVTNLSESKKGWILANDLELNN